MSLVSPGAIKREQRSFGAVDVPIRVVGVLRRARLARGERGSSKPRVEAGDVADDVGMQQRVIERRVERALFGEGSAGDRDAAQHSVPHLGRAVARRDEVPARALRRRGSRARRPRSTNDSPTLTITRASASRRTSPTRRCPGPRALPEPAESSLPSPGAVRANGAVEARDEIDRVLVGHPAEEAARRRAGDLGRRVDANVRIGDAGLIRRRR